MSFKCYKGSTVLNPCFIHLQKLGLELKCPLCMNLLNKPVLLPCNHVFCEICIPETRSECVTCRHYFTEQDIRPASYMENIVGIYKDLNTTFNSTALTLLSHDRLEILKEDGKREVLHSLHANHSAEQLLPGSSPPADDAKQKQGHVGNPGSINGRTESNTVKRSAADKSSSQDIRVDHDTFHEDTSQEREPKKQKKLSDGPPEAVTGSHAHSQQSVSDHDHDHDSDSNCDEENKTRAISSSWDFDTTYLGGSECLFCESPMTNEFTGPMLYYADGEEVPRDEATFLGAISVHRKCLDWAPQVSYDGETIKNLESEQARVSQLTCSSCGRKGATLGCFVKSCRRIYHLQCALNVPNCRLDHENFVMLCSVHKSIRLPCEKSNSRKGDSGEKHTLPSQITSEQSNFWTTSESGPQEWVFCGSTLSSEEFRLLVKFASACGATVFKFWNPKVTHVIAATDANGASNRTQKVLMAILNGKWVITMDWIKSCMVANCPVNEEPYEVKLVNHGYRDGPRSGRIGASNNAPKLFDGLSFYFYCSLVPVHENDILDLVKVGGGRIIDAQELIAVKNPSPQLISTTFVIHNPDHDCTSLSDELADELLSSELSSSARHIAQLVGAQAIPYTWILESIAAFRLLPNPLA